MPNPIALLSARRVRSLQRTGAKIAGQHVLVKPKDLDPLILSGKQVVPYVIENLEPRKVACAMQRVSIPVSQLSVEDLVDITQTQPERIGEVQDGMREVHWKSEFELVFGDGFQRDGF